MGLFKGQLANVVEWQEYRDDIVFWKWNNDEIKKGSKLIIRKGQDAIFMYNGKVEGIFKDEGSFDIESQIIPFLSTLKGFKFGFNSGIRAEVLFINTKEFVVKWGTKNAINLPAAGLPGGMPIRAFGTFSCKVSDYDLLIEKVAGIKKSFTIDEVREKLAPRIDPLLMKWILKEGRDMFNIQANSYEIGKGICSDLDMELCLMGISVTNFTIQSVTYPEEVQKMVTKAASQSMVGDVNKYQQIAAADSLAKGGGGSNVASSMVQMQMGMAMGQQMVNQMNQPLAGTSGQQASYTDNGIKPNFCPNCGTKTTGANFCPNCGYKLI